MLFDFRISTCGVIEPVGMPFLEEVLKEFPQTTFVGPAFCAEITAEVTMEDKNTYPKGEIKEPGKVDSLLADYPNLHADLSAMSGYNALARDLDYARKFLEKHHKKLLFGTDYFVRNKVPRIIELLNNIDLSSSTRECIFSKNAQQLLKL